VAGGVFPDGNRNEHRALYLNPGLPGTGNWFCTSTGDRQLILTKLEAQINLAGRSGRPHPFHICDWKTPTVDLLNDRGLMGEGCINIREISRWVDEAGIIGYPEVEIFSEKWWAQDQEFFWIKSCRSTQERTRAQTSGLVEQFKFYENKTHWNHHERSHRTHGHQPALADRTGVTRFTTDLDATLANPDNEIF
jgi:hypothetical protein